MAQNSSYNALIISDFHLGAGIQSGDFEHFLDDEEFSIFLNYYGKKFADTSLELIIAGDFFDSIQTRIDGTLPDRVYAHQAFQKTARITDGHPSVFKALKSFNSKPYRAITFLIGNHDPALLFPEVQSHLINLIGGDLRFEKWTVNRDLLAVKHGNEWDLANRFPTENIVDSDENGEFIRFPWGSYFVIRYIARIRKRIPDIDKIKPLGTFIKWAIFHRPLEAVIAVINFLFFILRYRFHHYKDQRVSFLQLVRILRGACYSCDMIDSAANFLNKHPARFLVIGHTHRALFQPVSNEKIFVNAGTWNQILFFENKKFISTQHRTFVLYSNPENNNPLIELLEWIPNRGPMDFKPEFINIHMHPKM